MSRFYVSLLVRELCARQLNERGYAMSKVSGEACRTVRLCVDSYEHGVLKGRYYNPGLGQGGRKFESLTEFLISAESLFDSNNFPQSLTDKRSFAHASSAVSGGLADSEYLAGNCGTFIIRLLYRQHTSWQGYVMWTKGGEERPFRSALELIFLVDSALRGCGEDVA